jgi:hypothetical protein
MTAGSSPAGLIIGRAPMAAGLIGLMAIALTCHERSSLQLFQLTIGL